MKRTKTVSSADTFANVITVILWLIYKFITVVLPILFMVWLALSMVEVAVNLDCFINGQPYEYNRLNFFNMLLDMFSK